MIETKRLILRLYKSFERQCCIDLLTDKEVMRFVDTGVFSLERAEKTWKHLIEEFYPNGIDTIFAVLAKNDSRYIGHAAIRPRPTLKEDWEISYMLKKEEWGKGFATEIAGGLIKYGFSVLNLDEIFATIDDEHKNSIKVIEKAGMRFRRYEFDEQGRFSVYSIKRKTNFSIKIK